LEAEEIIDPNWRPLPLHRLSGIGEDWRKRERINPTQFRGPSSQVVRNRREGIREGFVWSEYGECREEW
jgi:hypothetical protein